MFLQICRITSKFQNVFYRCGPEETKGVVTSSAVKRGGRDHPYRGDGGYPELEDVENYLEGLTGDLSDMELEDVPRALQHHTVRVPSRFRHFLWKVARVVAFYREHRP